MTDESQLVCLQFHSCLLGFCFLSFNLLYFAGFFHDLSKTKKNKKKGFEFIILFANVRWDVIRYISHGVALKDSY